MVIIGDGDGDGGDSHMHVTAACGNKYNTLWITCWLHPVHAACNNSMSGHPWCHRRLLPRAAAAAAGAATGPLQPMPW